MASHDAPGTAWQEALDAAALGRIGGGPKTRWDILGWEADSNFGGDCHRRNRDSRIWRRFFPGFQGHAFGKAPEAQGWLADFPPQNGGNRRDRSGFA